MVSLRTGRSLMPQEISSLGDTSQSILPPLTDVEVASFRAVRRLLVERQCFRRRGTEFVAGRHTPGAAGPRSQGYGARSGYDVRARCVCGSTAGRQELSEADRAAGSTHSERAGAILPAHKYDLS